MKLFAIAVTAALVGCEYVPGTEANKSATAVAAAERTVAGMLVDPGSAQFRNVTYHGAGGVSVCGEVNAKNRMGGYNGFMRFWSYRKADGEWAADIQSDDDEESFDVMWRLTCD